MIYNRYTPAAQEVDEQGYPDPKVNLDYYQKWWAEQTERCIHGYYPKKGDYINGDFYFHLNFCKGEVFDFKRNDKTISRFPYNDCDHELNDFLWSCEQQHIDGVVMKGRRAHFSTIMSTKLLCRWSFFPGTSLGVGTYKEEHQQKIRNMIEKSRSFLPIEFSYKAHANEEILESLTKVKTEVGVQTKGEFSAIYFRTFGGRTLNTGAFRSLSTKILLFDEIGENPVLDDCIAASEEGAKVGGYKYGLFVYGGTANSMQNASPFLEKLVYNPQDYHAKLHFIPRQRFYEDENFKPFYNPKTGIASKEDQEAAKAVINKEALRLYNLGNKKKYFQFLQENPTTLEECFLGNSLSKVLDMDKINQQIKSIHDWESLGNKLMRYNIHFKNGVYNPVRPEIEWEAHPDGEYWIAPGGMPDEQYKGLDIGGIDTYYASGAPTSDSVGAMYVFRRENLYDSQMSSNCPIVEYIARYPTNEQFYEGCLKLAIAYSFPGAPFKMLSEFDSTFLMYMEYQKALRYFKEKPTCIEGEFSKATNRYMVKMTGQAKTKGIALLQDYITDYVQNIPFMRLLEDMKSFGVKNTDPTMAFLVTLIHNEDEMIRPVERRESEVSVQDFFPYMKRSKDGKLTSPNMRNSQFEQENSTMERFLSSSNGLNTFLNT